MISNDDTSYFKHRQVRGSDYACYALPVYLQSRLPLDKHAHILDFGCGFGQFLRELSGRGYGNVSGYDIEPEAIAFCRANGLQIIDGNSASLGDLDSRYDFILSSHVIEHLPKDAVISTLRDLRKLLRPGGTLLVCVPNAQANTGSYWAYEDFTHHTVYTSGSLHYVLSKAGFSSVEFIDTDCTEGMQWSRRLLKRTLLSLYRANYRLWNRITGSATHASSPDIFSYEIKAVARD
jgi:2-polyprenyl-3-methyl-5-hydroxy-6-metoxy-1,4-benzoquinol methylase